MGSHSKENAELLRDDFYLVPGDITWAVTSNRPDYYSEQTAPELWWVHNSYENLAGFNGQFLIHYQDAFAALGSVICRSVANQTASGSATININGTTQIGEFFGLTHNAIGTTEGDNEQYRHDIWISTSVAGYSDEFLKLVVMHEALHALGYRHSFVEGQGNSIFNHAQSMKFTVMSYSGSEQLRGGSQSSSTTVLPSTFQLYDIWNLQNDYGIDKFTRNSDGDTYGNGLVFTAEGSPELATIWDAGGAHDAIDATAAPTSSIIDLRQGEFSSIGAGNAFSAPLENIAIAWRAVIEDATGSAFDDVIIGNVANNVIDGGGGNDIIFGDGNAYGLEHAAAFSRAGIDWRPVDKTSDDEGWVSDNDKVVKPNQNGSGDDTVFAGSGNDQVFGGAGNDTLEGGDGDDRVDGGADDDLILGEAGDDLLIGGDGADILIGGDGADTLRGGAGDDSLDGNNDDDYLDGGDGDDTLNGGGGNDVLGGGVGNDLLDGGTGNDELRGEDGEDELVGGAGYDEMHGGQGNDLLDGGTEDDILFGGSGIDQLSGGDGNDILHGDEGTDALDGGDGDDQLSGGADADTLSGGDGADLLNGDDGDDTLDGGAGNDTLDGGLGADLLFGNAGADILSGGEGADQLFGGADGDHLSGGAGDDELYGEAGVDVLYGDAGNDHLFGGSGNDTLSGGDGDDVISGGADDDQLEGGAGADTLSGGHGNDVLAGGDGNDIVDGGDGEDSLAGGSGGDRLLGGAGADQVDGGGGSDHLIGGDGHDILNGGADRDWLQGGTGMDLLSGGEGDDIVHAGDGDDIVYADGGADIVDGGEGKDRFDLRGYAPGGVHASIRHVESDGILPPHNETENGWTGLDVPDQPNPENWLELSSEAGIDRLTNIEDIRLSDESDYLNVSDLGSVNPLTPSQLSKVIIDFGGTTEPRFDDDMIDFSNAGFDAGGLGFLNTTVGVRVDLRDRANQTIDYLYTSTVSVAGESYQIQFANTLQHEMRIANANSVRGTANRDWLRAAGGGDPASGEGYSTLYGNAGDDVLIGGGWESHLFGGEGADRFDLRPNTFIEDAQDEDRVSFVGISLYGGVKQWWMEGGAAYWAPFSSLLSAFPVVGNSILMTAAFFFDQITMKFARYRLDGEGNLKVDLWGQSAFGQISDYHSDLDSGASSGGIMVFEAGEGDGSGASLGRIQKFVNLALKAGFGVGLGGFDPLVLDLDGDGFELITEGNSRAYFEFDGDGFGERTGWVRPDDGILAFDINANGKIDDISELFGNQTTSGFTMLSGLDSNADGKIDALDGAFSSILVWQDLDQDGVSDAGELKSLQSLGIVSISLSNAAPTEPTSVGGNTIARLGSFTLADGATGAVADVAFQINQTATRWLGDDTVSVDAAVLPQLKGFGEVKNLHLAMTNDATLKAMVSQFASLTTNDLSLLRADAEQILYRWAGVDSVAASALGRSGFDTRKLAFLEEYSGHQLMPRNGAGAVQLDNLEEVEALWADQLTRLTLRLIVQGPLSDVFDSIEYRQDLDLLVAQDATALADLFAEILADLPSDPPGALSAWQAWAPLLGAMTDGMRRSDANLVRSDYIAAQLLRAMDGVAQPLDFATLATALGISNLRVGSASADELARGAAEDLAIFVGAGGTDTLTGGGGQDVYIFGQTIGNTTINDVEANPAGDRIRFAFHNSDQVTLGRDGNDLLITVIATGETVRVTGQFAPVVPYSSDVLLSTNKGVEDIQFADGSIFEIPEIMAAVGRGTSGDDHLIGTMHSDVLTGGLGDDLLEGGDDADLYVINAGEGNDVICDVQSTPLLRAADLLLFGDDLSSDQITFDRAGTAGDDLLITIAGGQSILIEGQFSYSVLGYNDKLALNSRIEAFAFREYGEAWSHKDIQQQLIGQATSVGNDVTMGFGDDDEFGASAGNDTLIGLDGADTYHWGSGAGNDRIDEQARYIDVTVGLGGLSLTARADTVIFDESISLETLIFSRAYSTNDLSITNSLTGATLTIVGQFNSFQTGVLGAQWFDRIEWFQFADGSRISWKDVIATVTSGGAGNDQLRGDILDDLMVGGLGDDLLSGGGGGDRYVFAAGDGHDTLFDDNRTIIGDGFLTPDQTVDVLELGEGIAPSDITFSRNGSSITLTIGSTGDAITLQGQDDYIQTGVFGAIATNRIEQVKFHDGTIWSWQDVNARMIAAQTTVGNDVTTGFTLEDRFEKSAGDDVLRGGDSGDTYVFGVGAGHDRIEESVSNVLYGDGDTVEFDSTVAVGDVSLARDGNDLIATLPSGDSLRIAGQFALQTLYTWTDVETFRFADGTVWTKADVQEKLLQATAGDDHLIGFYSNDTLDGGAGADILEGRDGNDTYRFDRGYGNDEIRESVTELNVGDFDQVVFGPTLLPQDLAVSREGNDLVLTIIDTGEALRISGQFNFGNWFAWNDVELFTFANGASWTDRDIATRLTGGTAGDDHILGTFRSDTLDGKAGNDILEGGDGSDIYIFGIGYGQDEIRETLTTANLGEDDALRFGAGITLQDLGFERIGNDLLITVLGSTDSIRIVGQFNNSSWFSWHDVERFSFADGSFITRNDIQQTLLTGTSGNDHLVGFFDANTLDGGAGDDLLEGKDGADTYVFGRGYGHDRIRETKTDGNLSDDDTVALADGITPDDVTLIRDGYDLIIQLDTGDTLTIESHFSEGFNEALTYLDIDRIRFASGVEWSKTDILLKVLQSTPGNDILIGGAQTDVLDGGAGDDWLQGEEGSDKYVWGTGHGNDTIQERYNLVTRPEFDELTIHGIEPAELQLSRQGEDLILTLPSGEHLTINGQLHPWGWTDIEQINFDDGTVWSQSDLTAALLVQEATSGDDVIHGFDGDDQMFGAAGNDTLHGGAGNDVFVGGAGSDLLRGGTGNDVYRLNIGDGQDIITDERTGWDSGVDAIEFGPGISPAGVTVSRDGIDLVLTITGTSDSLRLTRGARDVGGVSHEIEQVRFADGTIWTSAMVRSMARVITTGADTLEGSDGAETLDGLAGDDLINAHGGNDILIGGLGNDTLVGESGDDTYRYALGDGDDIINDNIEGWGGYHGFDTIEFAAGIDPSQVIVTGVDNDFRITFTGHAGSLLLVGAKAQTTSAVERIVFANGAIWDYDALAGRSVGATEGADIIDGTNLADVISGLGGNDTIKGRQGNDTLAGNAGNDTVYGGSGDDIYRFNLGDGHDVLDEYDESGSGYDKLVFGEGIAPADIAVTQGNNGYDFILKIAGTSDQVTLRMSNAWNSQYRLDEVAFADGTVWSLADLVAKMTTAGDDSIRGRIEADSIEGGAGNDFIRGDAGDDALAGGLGNDTIHGGSGNDTFVFNLGDGQDIIDEFNESGSGFDKLVFGAGISPGDIRVTQSNNGMDMVLSVVGTTDRVTMRMGNAWNSQYRVDEVHFANGTVWNFSQLLQQMTSSGSDQIYGNFEAQTLSSGAGDDWIDVRGGNDILIGGTGDDFLSGGGGDDTYRYSRGDGHDVVQDYRDGDSGSGGTDAIEFGVGISPSDVTMATSGNDFILYIDGGEGSVKIANGADGWNLHWIEEVRFADGTIWPRSSFAARATSVSNNADLLSGTSGADTLRGLGGDDQIDGMGGNDIINGDAGADRLSGNEGNDTLEGGAGADILIGDTRTRDAVGGNLLVNGSFETSGTVVGSGSWGIANSTLPGWSKANSQPFEQVGVWGVSPSDGSYWHDLDSAGGSGSNMDISQSVSGLAAGDVMILQFDHANPTSASSGAFEVYWNNTLVASISETGSNMRTEIYSVVATAGSNVLRFKALGAEDGSGGAIDNVRLFATAETATGSGDDLLWGGTGNDIMFGGAGQDVARFVGQSAEYSIIDNGDGSYAIEDLVADRDETDIVWEIETLRFSDGDFNPVDLLGGGASAQRTAVTIGTDWEGEVYQPLQAEDSGRAVAPSALTAFGPDISGRFGLRPILENPRAIVRIDTLGSDQANASVQAAASSLIESIATFESSAASHLNSEQFEATHERDLWVMHGRMSERFTSA